MAGTLPRKTSRWRLTMMAELIPTSTTPSRQWPSLPATYTVSAETSFKRYLKRRTPGSAKSWLSEVSNTSTTSSVRGKNVRRWA